MKIKILTLIGLFAFNLNVAWAACQSANFNLTQTGSSGVVQFLYVGDGANCVENYSIDWGDGQVTTGVNMSPGLVLYHTYQTLGVYSVTLSTSSGEGECGENCDATLTQELPIESGCCGNDISLKGMTTTVGTSGSFYFNSLNGQFVFVRNNCPAEYPFNCLKTLPHPEGLDGVVSTEFHTFADEWEYDDTYYFNVTGSNNDPFETGEAGNWRVRKNFVYREKLDLLSTDYRNYDRGTFPMEMFNWKNDGVFNDEDKWVLTSTITDYDPNGQPTEDENILGVHSAATYGYNHTQPIAVAQNAELGTISFEGFEEVYTDGSTDYFENGLEYVTAGGTRTNVRAHTGEYSLKLQDLPDGQYDCDLVIGNFTFNQQLKDEGLMVRIWLWVNPDKPEPNTSGGGNMEFGFQRPKNGYWTPMSCVSYWNKVAEAGEWMLYEATISPGAFTWDTYGPGGAGTGGWTIGDKGVVTLKFKNWGVDYQVGDLYLDDVRLQPKYSEMITYVYDDAQRVTAIFDDHHFPLIYQYNMAGELVRKVKETEQGLKTISETQSNSEGELNW